MENIWNKRLYLLLMLEVDSDSESDLADELQSDQDRTDWVSQYHRFMWPIFGWQNFKGLPLHFHRPFNNVKTLVVCFHTPIANGNSRCHRSLYNISLQQSVLLGDACETVLAYHWRLRKQGGTSLQTLRETIVIKIQKVNIFITECYEFRMSFFFLEIPE